MQLNAGYTIERWLENKSCFADVWKAFFQDEENKKFVSLVEIFPLVFFDHEKVITPETPPSQTRYACHLWLT